MDCFFNKWAIFIARQLSSQRHLFLPKINCSTGPFSFYFLQVSSIPYKDQLADLIGCKPDLRRLFFKDPLLAFKCFFGPCCAAQYRLMGPGAWPGAKGVIEETYRNKMFPHVEKKNETAVSKHQTIIKVLKLVFMFVTVATLKELSQDLRGEWDAVVGWLRAGR